MRISVVGCSGSGKTTLARAIARALGVPHLELDSVFHQANWTQLDDDAFRARVSAYCAGPAWVVDGNYGSRGITEIVWRRADAVVWLDFPKHLVMRQLIWRSLRRGIARTPLWNGNRERLRNLLSTDPNENVVLWAADSHGRLRERYAAAMVNPRWARLTFHRLQSAQERDALLHSVGGSRSLAGGNSLS